METNTTPALHVEFHTAAQVDAWRRLILAVAPAASTDNTRGAIHCVQVEVTADELRMTATDSYLLVTATMPAPEAPTAAAAAPPTNTVIPAEWLTKMAKTIKRTDPIARLTVTDEELTHYTPTAGATTTTNYDADQTFPKWRPLMPTDPNYTADYRHAEDNAHDAPSAVNPTFLANLAKMAASIHPKNNPGPLIITHTHPRRPWLMTTTTADGIEWTGLLMPVRIP